jgi:hypothetical protein
MELWHGVLWKIETDISEEPAPSIFCYTLNMQAAGSSEMSITVFETTMWHDSETQSLFSWTNYKFSLAANLWLRKGTVLLSQSGSHRNPTGS